MRARGRMDKALDHLGIDLSVLKQWDFEILDVKPQGRVVKLETDVGVKCLDIRDRFDDHIFNYFLLLEHLAEQGFKRIPRFVRTGYGESYIKIKGRCYWISDWIEGRHINYKDQDDIVKSSQELARFHLAARGFYPPGEKEEDFEIHNWSNDFSSITSQITKIRAQIKPSNKGTELFKENLQMIGERAVNSFQVLVGPGYTGLRQKLKEDLGVCHGSYSKEHLILGNYGQIYLTGLANWKRDITLRDLAEFLFLVGEKNQWNDQLCQKLVLSYHKTSPLLVLEMEILKEYLRFPFGYLAVLKDLAQKNAGAKETKIKLEFFLRGEEEKEKCLLNLF